MKVDQAEGERDPVTGGRLPVGVKAVSVNEETDPHPAYAGQERRDVLLDVMAHLAAAISLLENTPKAKKAAPSDKMFDQMLVDYRNSLERGRQFLKRQGGQHD